MLISLVKKKRVLFIFLVGLFCSSSPLIASKLNKYKDINILLENCYQDIKYCDETLLKINIFQKNAAKNKKFSCQTRLLGLEANIIMAMNYNFKRNEVKSLINSIRKYC